MIDERLPERHEWHRICEASWDDPLHPTVAQVRGGRWNPPGSWRTLYLDEDVVTALRCRSAQATHGAGREVAWFPATSRSRAHLVTRRFVTEWFWS